MAPEAGLEDAAEEVACDEKPSGVLNACVPA
jgi:hypothetical protein